MIKLWWNNKGRLNHFEGEDTQQVVGKALTEPLICAELCCLKDMATRCPFGWNSRFQSNLSFLGAKNVSAPRAARQETLGAERRGTFSSTRSRRWEFFSRVFTVLWLQLYFINLICKCVKIHNFPSPPPPHPPEPLFSLPGKSGFAFVQGAQDLGSPRIIAIDGSVLPYSLPSLLSSLPPRLCRFFFFFPFKCWVQNIFSGLIHFFPTYIFFCIK